MDISGGGVVDHLQPGEDYSRFKVEILEQAVGVEFHEIATVNVHSLAENAGEYPDSSVFCIVQHDEYLAEVFYFVDIIVSYPAGIFSRQNPIFISQISGNALYSANFIKVTKHIKNSGQWN